MTLSTPWSPQALVDEASSWFERTRGSARGARTDVFVRTSTRVRASHTGIEATTLVGTESGIAVRACDRSRKGEGFAAASFVSGEATGDTLVRRAVEDARHAPPTTSGWLDTPLERLDLETPLDLPPPEELAGWLERAWGLLDERVREADPASPRPSAWVETAATIEVWIDDRGTRAVRARRRAWAMALYRGRALPDASERPRFLAGRDFASLDAGTWAEDFDESPGPARLPDRPPALPWVLTPAAAAVLIPVLALRVHGSGGAEGERVGAGWCLADDPTHEKGIVGGVFDDVGFEAGRRVLAEGGSIRGALDGPGTFRRPSYRDRPASFPTTLVVSPPDVGRPARFYRVQAVRIHPLEANRWLLELDGVRREADAAAEVFQGARAVVRPRELLGACVGGIGAPRMAAWGVVTPGLVFEGLRLE